MSDIWQDGPPAPNPIDIDDCLDVWGAPIDDATIFAELDLNNDCIDAGGHLWLAQGGDVALHPLRGAGNAGEGEHGSRVMNELLAANKRRASLAITQSAPRQHYRNCFSKKRARPSDEARRAIAALQHPPAQLPR
jgi:hypothetical protein